MKKLIFLIFNVYACMASSTFAMELPTYLPHAPSTYALAATLVTSIYYASRWYTQTTPVETYLDVTRLDATHLDAINMVTCSPTAIDPTSNQIATPWHALVEQIQNNTLPNQATMQVEANNTIAIDLHKGVLAHPEHKTLFLFSRGFAARGGLPFVTEKPATDCYQNVVSKGGGLMAGHMAIKDNLVTNAPCYAFDYPDKPRHLNLGQTKDLECLRTTWQEILAKNPQADIVGIGDCRGSKALLEFATEQPEKLKALVLMAPFVSLHELACHIARNYLRFPYADKLLYAAMRYGLPAVNLEADNLADRLNLINTQVPVFIVHRKGDSVISYHDIQLLVKALHTSGNKDIYLLEVTDDSAAHSRLSHIPEVQQALNAFYARHQLPHNAQLAQEGQMALKKAQDAIQSIVSAPAK